MKIAGATVFRGLEGYGETGEMHRAHLVRHDQPILISIVDTAENIARLAPVIEQMMDTGVLAESDVQVVRVQKNLAALDE
jgi:PII-like signaling protein